MTPIYEPPSRPIGTGTVLAFFGMVTVVGLVVIVVALIKSGSNAPVAKKAPPAERRVEAPPPRVTPVTPDGDAVAGAFFFWVICILYLVGVALMLAWVARDAKNRAVDGGAVWVLVILFTGFIGLLVYLASRPTGVLGICENCHNRRLLYAKHCPHCGHA
jgi:hypothetical protein